MKVKMTIMMDKNIKIGRTNMGYIEKIPIKIQYRIFLKYLSRIKDTPNLLFFSMPLKKHCRFLTILPF